MVQYASAYNFIKIESLATSLNEKIPWHSKVSQIFPYCKKSLSQEYQECQSPEDPFFLKFSSKSQTGYICLVLVISQNEVYQSGKKCLTKLLLGKLQFL